MVPASCILRPAIGQGHVCTPRGQGKFWGRRKTCPLRGQGGSQPSLPGHPGGVWLLPPLPPEKSGAKGGTGGASPLAPRAQAALPEEDARSTQVPQRGGGGGGERGRKEGKSGKSSPENWYLRSLFRFLSSSLPFRCSGERAVGNSGIQKSLLPKDRSKLQMHLSPDWKRARKSPGLSPPRPPPVPGVCPPGRGPRSPPVGAVGLRTQPRKKAHFG